MSGLDVAAAFVGLASTGMLVARGLIQIADAIRSAGEEVRLCGSELALFSQMLEELVNALHMPTATARGTQRTVEDLVDLCQRVLHPFRRLLEHLKPLIRQIRGDPYRLRHFGLRIQWYFKYRSKIDFYRRSLGHLKTTLTCLLASMNLQEARASSSPQIFIYQMNVVGSRASLNSALRTDRTIMVDAMHEHVTNSHLRLGGAIFEPVSESAQPEVEEPPESMNAGSDIDSSMDSLNLETLPDEMDEDESRDTAAAVRIDLLSLQQKVSRIATAVLKEPSSTDQQFQGHLLEPSSPAGVEGTDEDLALPRHESIPNSQTANLPKPLEKVEPLTIIDPLGRAWALPYTECKTFENILRIIAAHLKNDDNSQWTLPTLGAASSAYTTLFPFLDDKALIPSGHWTGLVHPGTSITLRTSFRYNVAISQSSETSISAQLDPMIFIAVYNAGNLEATFEVPLERCSTMSFPFWTGNERLMSNRQKLCSLFEHTLFPKGQKNDYFFYHKSGRDEYMGALKPFILTLSNGNRILEEFWDNSVKPQVTLRLLFNPRS